MNFSLLKLDLICYKFIYDLDCFYFLEVEVVQSCLEISPWSCSILNFLEVEVVWTMECNADKCNASNSQCKVCNILTLYSVFDTTLYLYFLRT